MIDLKDKEKLYHDLLRLVNFKAVEEVKYDKQLSKVKKLILRLNQHDFLNRISKNGYYVLFVERKLATELERT